MTVEERNNFSGPGTIILKVNFLCINGTRKPLLIHGFPPVNALLLTVYGTAFYAIIAVIGNINYNFVAYCIIFCILYHFLDCLAVLLMSLESAAKELG